MENVRETINRGLVIGTLSEKSLKLEEVEVSLNDGKKAKCNRVNGKIVIQTKNGNFESWLNQSELTKAGGQNRLYPNALEILNKYVSLVDVSKNPELTADIVKASMQLNCRDNYSTNTGKVSSYPQLKLGKLNRDPNAESQTDFVLEGIIRSIKPEVNLPKNETEEPEETGRLIVEFITINYLGEAEPFTLILPEDMVEPFTEGYTEEDGTEIPPYTQGTTCVLGVEVVMKHVGSKKKQKAGFGRGANVVDGFDVMELVIIGGEPPYSEDSEDESTKPFTMEVMKGLMAERKMKLDKIEEDGKNGKTNNSTSTPKTKTTKGLKGGRTANVQLDDDEAPF